MTIDFESIPEDALHLIGCSASKQPNGRPARELYTGDLFRKTRDLLEANGANFAILSAEHGVIDPHAIINPYDTKMPSRQYDRGFWAGVVFGELVNNYLKSGPDTVVFWAGRDYRDGLAEQLGKIGCHTLAPLSGLGIGEQKALLASSLREAVPA